MIEPYSGNSAVGSLRPTIPLPAHIKLLVPGPQQLDHMLDAATTWQRMSCMEVRYRAELERRNQCRIEPLRKQCCLIQILDAYLKDTRGSERRGLDGSARGPPAQRVGRNTTEPAEKVTTAHHQVPLCTPQNHDVYTPHLLMLLSRRRAPNAEPGARFTLLNRG